MYYAGIQSLIKLAFNRKASSQNSVEGQRNLLSKSGQFESERKQQLDAGTRAKDWTVLCKSRHMVM